MFYSILFPKREQHDSPTQEVAPGFFKDLNLDQVFAPVLESKEAFNLEGFFFSPLRDPQIIVYRQEIMRDLENAKLRGLIAGFSKSLYSICQYAAGVRADLSSYDSSRNNYLTRGRLLNCAEGYCSGIAALMERLPPLTLHSEGLRGFSDYIKEYCDSQGFADLCNETKKLREAFSKIRYCMHIKHGEIKVRKYEGQADYTEKILTCFEKFRQGDAKSYHHEVPEEPIATHVEAAVLGLLSNQYMHIFSELESFCAKHLRFEDNVISMFSCEVQFYLSWLGFIEPVKNAGLPFCYPFLSEVIDGLYSADGYDLALAHLIRGGTVVNSFAMDSPEQIIVVTGPNQGGKSTFARAFGQMHYLASLGLCVPGREAKLYLFDRIYTHFGREEDLSTQNGKLHDDLVRLRALLDDATGQSIVIINEIFTSTDISNAIILGKQMMDALVSLRSPAVVVTFLDELAMHGDETVSMMSTVDESDTTRRTFQIVRKPPAGIAYAAHIAGKYGLTYEQLSGRLTR